MPLSTHIDVHVQTSHAQHRAQVPDVHPYTDICLHMPRSHTHSPADVHTALTCHTCPHNDICSHLRSHANQPTAALVPLAHIHACRAHLYFQVLHISIPQYLLLVHTHEHLHTLPVRTGVPQCPFLYNTHQNAHCVFTSRPHTITHLLQVSSPLQSCYSRNQPGHQSRFAHRENSASKLYPSPGSIPSSSTHPAGGIQQCLQHSTAYRATPRGSPLPPSSHPSLHISRWKQKMSSGAGQLCRGTRAGAPSHHEPLKQQCLPTCLIALPLLPTPRKPHQSLSY